MVGTCGHNTGKDVTKDLEWRSISWGGRGEGNTFLTVGLAKSERVVHVSQPLGGASQRTVMSSGMYARKEVTTLLSSLQVGDMTRVGADATAAMGPRRHEAVSRLGTE